MSNNITVKFRKTRRKASHLLISIPLDEPLGRVDTPKGQLLQTSLFDETTATLTYKDVWMKIKRNRCLDNPETLYVVVEKQKRPPF